MNAINMLDNGIECL